MRRGNESQYRAMVMLLKNAMFNLAQAQDMLANYTIAKDICEMRQFNKAIFADRKAHPAKIVKIK